MSRVVFVVSVFAVLACSGADDGGFGGAGPVPSPDGTAPDGTAPDGTPIVPTPAVPVPPPVPFGEFPPIDETPFPEDCTVDANAARKALLPIRVGLITVDVHRQPGLTVETVPFDKKPIRISRGGCEHFGETWQTEAAADADPWKAARTMRSRIKTMGRSKLDTCLKALPKDSPAEFSPAEIETCSASIDNGLLTASWSAAI